MILCSQFEVVFSYRDFLADCYANIDLAYETENSCFSYNFTCQGFHFSGQNLEVPEKYKYVKTPTKVTCYGDIYEGDSLMEYLSCAFTKDVGVKLDKLGKISDNFYLKILFSLKIFHFCIIPRIAFSNFRR